MLDCIICDREAVNMPNHIDDELNGDGKAMLSHMRYHKEVVDSGFEKPCFCGGAIIISTLSLESWEAICSQCDYFWGEE